MKVTIDNWRHETERKMKDVLEYLSSAFVSIRSGRAHTGMLENIVVEAYDQRIPLKQVSTVTISQNQTFMVRVWDSALVSNVDRAIKSENLGLNPVIDGSILNINLPPMSQERRQEVLKIVMQKSEESKIVLRNVRRSMMNEIREIEGTGQDDIKNIEKHIQKITDIFMEKVHLLTDRKRIEITEK